MIKLFRIHKNGKFEFISKSESAKSQLDLLPVINKYLSSLNYLHYQYECIGRETRFTAQCWNFDACLLSEPCMEAEDIEFHLEYSGAETILNLLGINSIYINYGLPMN